MEKLKHLIETLQKRDDTIDQTKGSIKKDCIHNHRSLLSLKDLSL
jgi:hypothetical protein